MASVNCQDLQQLIAKVIFQGDLSALPSNFYLGLGTGLLPQKDDTLADISEVSGPGYGRQLIARNSTDWPSLVLSVGNWKVSSITRAFIATSGDWTAADFAFLTDVASGTSGRLFTAATLNVPFLNVAGDEWDGVAEWIGSP